MLSTIDPWALLSVHIVVVAIWFCWWFGFRWRGFLLLLGCMVVAGFVWRTVIDVTTPHPGWLHGLTLLDATIRGAIGGGSSCLLALLVYHWRRRRRQAAHLGALLSAIDRDHEGTLWLPDGTGLERLEELERVKYVCVSRSEGSGLLVYDDWHEALSDSQAPGEIFLLVPGRTRISYSDARGVWPSNKFDCVVLQRTGGSRVAVTPASHSRFCQRVVSIIPDRGGRSLVS